MSRICVIRQGAFPGDPRLKREVDALVMAGHEVDIICRAQPDESLTERSGPVTVRRLPVKRCAGGGLCYLVSYMTFFLIAAAVVGVLHVRRRYHLVQVNTVPDALVFAAVVPRLLGARVLLDLHECMPEFFATKFKTGPEHPVVRVIARLEQASIRFADYAITCTEQMRQAFVMRGADEARIGVVHNGSDEVAFNPERYPWTGRDRNRFVLISHGSIDERYGLDTIIRAVGLLKGEIPGLRLDIYGDGPDREDLRSLTERLNVEREVYFSPGIVPLEELIRAIAVADVGVVAMKRDAFRDLTLCNKMYDFIVMRKPVISSRTESVEAYYGESCFLLFSSGDERELAQAIRELYEDPGIGERLAREAACVNEPYRWPHQRKLYLRIVENLLGTRNCSARRGPDRFAATTNDQEGSVGGLRIGDA